MEEFLSDWLTHSEYWFQKEKRYDTYLVDKYGGLLYQPWDKENVSLNYHLGTLIVYDQIARHMYREDPEKKVEFYLEKAIEVYKHIRQNFRVNTLSALEWSFLALPIRHSKNARAIIQVIQETWMRLKDATGETEKKQYSRFLKAAYERMPASQEQFIEHSVSEDTHIRCTLQDFTHYLDILHYCPITQETRMDVKCSNIYRTMENFVVKNKLKRVLLSLSGGVDSLVCSYVLKKLQEKWKFSIVAVHINYMNRSIREYEFVKDWCLYLGIPLYTRHITEIQRTPCMENGLRTTYETYTKKVRFQTYKDVWNCKYGDFPKVILGHNHDDCFENILTNVCHKSKYENLRGMYDSQILDDIIFLRPLLDIPKQDIYTLAHNVNVPYLHDSTPKWSQRGKIRDKVRPTLEEWNQEMIPGLFELADRVAEYEEISESVVNTMLESTRQLSSTQKEMYLLSTIPMFSKTLWKKYFQRQGITVSHRSLSHFMEHFEKHIETNKQYTEPVQVTLNKTTKLYYQPAEGYVYMKIHHESLDG